MVQRPSLSQAGTRQSTYGDSFAKLEDLDGSPAQCAVNAIGIQCLLGQAKAGAVLQGNAQQSMKLLALYPPPPQTETPPAWLDQALAAASKAISARESQVESLPSPNGAQARESRLLVLPLSRTVGLAEAFVIEAADEGRFARSRQTLEATALLLALGEKRLENQGNRGAVERLNKAMSVLASINEHQRFRAAAMAFCNEIASQWRCERACLGLLKGRYVRLEALSHTEHFGRKMKLIQDIEAAIV